MSKDLPANDSVSKSLRILLLLGARDSVGVSEVGRELGVAVSTAHRLLNIMRLHGFIEQVGPSRRYRLGAAALQLARQEHREIDVDLVTACHPFLARLGSELDETIDLVVLSGAQAHFIDGIESGQFPRVAARTGLRLPAYVTAGGKALLAQLPNAAVREQYPDKLTTLTRLSHHDVTSLERELQRIRFRGFALDRGEYHADVQSIGVAICDPRGRAVAALAVVGPTARWGIRKLKTLAPIVTDMAGEIARNLPERGN